MTEGIDGWINSEWDAHAIIGSDCIELERAAFAAPVCSFSIFMGDVWIHFSFVFEPNGHVLDPVVELSSFL